MPTILPPPIEPILRPAVPGDLDALVALIRQLGHEGSETVVKEEVARRLTVLLEHHDHALLVAVMGVGEPPIGWIHVFAAPRLPVESFAEIGGMVVDGRHRGQGIGRRLVVAAEGWARQKGLRKLRVRSQRERQGAHAFYRRLRFVASKGQTVFDKPIGR